MKDTRKGQRVGHPRNFSVVNVCGIWLKGWEYLEFKPDEKENEFFTKNKLWGEDNSIEFKNFVHPALFLAAFGSRYYETKSLLVRITDEAKFYKEKAQEIRDLGVKRPRFYYSTGGNFFVDFGVKSEFLDKDEEDIVKVGVPNLEAKIWLPDFIGDYPLLGIDENNHIIKYKTMPSKSEYEHLQNILVFSERRVKELTYKIGWRLQDCVRAVELAFFLYGFDKDKNPKLNEIPWDIPEFSDFKEKPRAKNIYLTLDFGDGIRWGYRLRETTQRVKESSIDDKMKKKVTFIEEI